MDFTSRMTTQPQPARAPAPQPLMDAPRTPERLEKVSRRNEKSDWLTMGSKIGTGALLVIITLLIGSLVWFIAAASPTPQNNYVDGTKLQAVFLNTGQVYFGNVRSLNKDYIVLSGVYYLQSSSASTSTAATSANQNVSLIKLGCELHRPYDTMVINSTQVTFWENLQSTGQVAKAVAQFQQQNPKGQTCSTQPASTSSTLQSQTTTKP
jgi:hypothetical protein